MKKYTPLTTSLLILLWSSTMFAKLSCETPLFATGFDREPIRGTKAALIGAISQGENIRIGWELDFDKDGIGDLTHWADAAFLSIIGDEVFTQVAAINTQTPKLKTSTIEMRAPYTEWRGSIGTTGVLEGTLSDNAVFPSDLSIATMWCAPKMTALRPQLLYRHGPDGEPLEGSIDALFAAIREGQSLRIGWGFSTDVKGKKLSIEHLIEPVFVTAINGKHVSAQLPEHIAQRAYHIIGQSFFDDPAVMWRGLMTTQGTFDAVWINRGTGETVRRYPQRSALSWFALSAPELDTPTLAVPGGVRRDEKREDEKFPK